MLTSRLAASAVMSPRKKVQQLISVIETNEKKKKLLTKAQTTELSFGPLSQGGSSASIRKITQC